MKNQHKLCLFYIAKPNVGGWISFTTHLIRSLKQLAIPVELYKIGNRTEKRERQFAEGCTYRNVSVEDGVSIAEKNLSLIVALDKRLQEKGLPILTVADSIVVHDPTEIPKDILKFIEEHKKKVIVIRKSMVDKFTPKGVQAKFIQHPYIPYTPEKINKDWHAVCISRLDWDKYTHYIVEANTLLNKEERVKLYGADNRLYLHYKVETKFPNWKDDYYGRFEYGAGPTLSGRSEFTVDLTEIKNDGGGTQYTFLEAFNANSTLIINRKWITNAAIEDCMQEGVNCLAVDSPLELAETLKSKVEHKHLREAGFELLKNHVPEVVIPEYFDFLCQ